MFGSQSLSDYIRIIFLSCPPVNEERIRGNTRYASPKNIIFLLYLCTMIILKQAYYVQNSGIFSELVRTNELCGQYSDVCIKVGQETGVKVVDLFSAFQRRDDWMNTCFT